MARGRAHDRPHRQWAEYDVAYDHTIGNRDKGQYGRASFAKGIDDSAFPFLIERLSIDLPDRVDITRLLISYRNHVVLRCRRTRDMSCTPGRHDGAFDLRASARASGFRRLHSIDGIAVIPPTIDAADQLLDAESGSSMFSAPLVEPLQRIPSQYVTISAPLSRWAVVAVPIVRCGIFIAPRIWLRRYASGDLHRQEESCLLAQEPRSGPRDQFRTRASLCSALAGRP